MKYLKLILLGLLTNLTVNNTNAATKTNWIKDELLNNLSSQTEFIEQVNNTEQCGISDLEQFNKPQSSGAKQELFNMAKKLYALNVENNDNSTKVSDESEKQDTIKGSIVVIPGLQLEKTNTDEVSYEKPQYQSERSDGSKSTSQHDSGRDETENNEKCNSNEAQIDKKRDEAQKIVNKLLNKLFYSNIDFLKSFNNTINQTINVIYDLEYFKKSYEILRRIFDPRLLDRMNLSQSINEKIKTTINNLPQVISQKVPNILSNILKYKKSHYIDVVKNSIYNIVASMLKEFAENKDKLSYAKNPRILSSLALCYGCKLHDYKQIYKSFVKDSSKFINHSTIINYLQNISLDTKVIQNSDTKLRITKDIPESISDLNLDELVSSFLTEVEDIQDTLQLYNEFSETYKNLNII